MGLQAFALSRLAGCCVGMKIVVDTADASSIIDLDRIRPEITAIIEQISTLPPPIDMTDE